jgi:hypothetical protein
LQTEYWDDDRQVEAIGFIGTTLLVEPEVGGPTVTHEDFSRQEDIKPSSDRSFGLVIATFFLIITFWPLIHAEAVRWWALAVAAAFAVVALVWTAALAPLNKCWTKLGILL